LCGLLERRGGSEDLCRLLPTPPDILAFLFRMQGMRDENCAEAIGCQLLQFSPRPRVWTENSKSIPSLLVLCNPYLVVVLRIRTNKDFFIFLFSPSLTLSTRRLLVNTSRPTPYCYTYRKHNSTSSSSQGPKCLPRRHLPILKMVSHFLDITQLCLGFAPGYDRQELACLQPWTGLQLHRGVCWPHV
jgi:hypothetical protein